MIRASRIVSTVMVLLMVLPGMVWGFSDNKGSRETLRGIKNVILEVTAVKPEIQKTGLSRSRIQTAVELKLRMAGLNVLTLNPSAFKDASLKEARWPRLYVYAFIVNINALSSAPPLYDYNIELDLVQLVHLARNNELAWATTWSTGFYRMATNLDDVRNAIKDEADEFINAWLSVNPK